MLIFFYFFYFSSCLFIFIFILYIFIFSVLFTFLFLPPPSPSQPCFFFFFFASRLCSVRHPNYCFRLYPERPKKKEKKKEEGKKKLLHNLKSWANFIHCSRVGQPQAVPGLKIVSFKVSPLNQWVNSSGRKSNYTPENHSDHTYNLKLRDYTR